jgi:DNA polymerase sigma
MSKKKKNKDNEADLQTLIRTRIHPRRLNAREKKTFERVYRQYSCLAFRHTFQSAIGLDKIDRNFVRHNLGVTCKTIEHQIVRLRDITRLKERHLTQRKMVTRHLVDCLSKHHNVIYEGILFGSTVNGLGFVDSDLDLRLRPLKKVGPNELEPVHFDKDFAENTLRNIAFQTTRCAPAIGNFVPSSRCPIAKLTFLQGDPKMPKSLQEGLSYDISLSSTSSLGSFNSLFLRFLCKLSPKFHLMATVLRYWSKVHKVVASGYLSSYALVNMLMYFCQNLNPPLLPTVDQMRDIQIAKEFKEKKKSNGGQDKLRALTRLEWLCVVCMEKSLYPKCSNDEPVAVLLLKFFEFYLNFPYSTDIIITRTGRSLPIQKFKTSDLYHPRFPIKEFINIQDPFDLTHNLTCGMTGEHFNTLIIAFRYSYERLHNELTKNFFRPASVKKACKNDEKSNGSKQEASPRKPDLRDWGLNAIFVDLTENEKRNAW